MDRDKERAKMNRYMNLELATKLTERTKDRLRNKYEQDRKRLYDFLDKKSNS
jgi:hypothetical protein